PETHEGPTEDQQEHRVGPALQRSGTCLSGLSVLDQPLALGEPLPLGADARFLGRLACGEECTLQISDLRRVVPSACNPLSGVGQFATTQQEVIGVLGLAACLPAGGLLAEPRVCADPFDILAQRGREFYERQRKGLTCCEDRVVEAPQLDR